MLNGDLFRSFIITLVISTILPGAFCHGEETGRVRDLSKESAKPLEERLLQDPGDTEARRKLVALYADREDPQKAIAHYRKILKRSPDDVDAMEALAMEYMWSGRPLKARGMLEKVLEQDPGREKSRLSLELLRSVKHAHRKIAQRHGHISDRIKSHPEQLEVYRKMADDYLHVSAYEKARRYYKAMLKLDPANVRAQRKLDEVERMMRPQSFAQVDYFKIKGDAEHLVQTYGFSMYLEQGYSMESDYVIKRRTMPGERRLTTQEGTMEISRAFGGDLVLFGGAVFKYYGMDEQAVVDPYFRFQKSLTSDLSLTFEYRKEHQDAKYDILVQRVDRHGFSLDCHYSPGGYFSVNADLEGGYYTEGYAPDDNAGISLSFSPAVHILREGPVLDLSYTYHRMDFLRKTQTVNGAEFEYEYYSPRVLEVHGTTLYASHDLFKGHLNVAFSDTISYRPHGRSMHNMIYTELKWRFSDRGSVSGVFVRTRAFDNVGDSFQMSQQFTLKFSHLF